MILDPDIFIDGDLTHPNALNPFLQFGNASMYSAGLIHNYVTSGTTAPCIDTLGHTPLLPYLPYSAFSAQYACFPGIPSSAKLYRFRLTWNQLGVHYNSAPDLNDLIHDCWIYYNIQSRCPNDPAFGGAQKMRVFFYHLPNTGAASACPDDRILIGCSERTYTLLCPGCANQGIESKNFVVNRLNYGYKDADGDGLWDPDGSFNPQRITLQNADSTIARDRVMVGDTFECRLDAMVHLWNNHTSCGSFASGNYYPSGDMTFKNGYWHLGFDFTAPGLQTPATVQLINFYLTYEDDYTDTALYSHNTGMTPCSVFKHSYRLASMPSSSGTMYSGPTAPFYVLPPAAFNSTVDHYLFDYSCANLVDSAGNPLAPIPKRFPDAAHMSLHAQFIQNGNSAEAGTNMMLMAIVNGHAYLTLKPEPGAIDPGSVSGLSMDNTIHCPLIDSTHNLHCDTLQWACTQLGGSYYQVGYQMKHATNRLDDISPDHANCAYGVQIKRSLEVGQQLYPFSPSSVSQSSQIFDVFPHEYRNWNFPDSIHLVYPSTFSFNGFSHLKQLAMSIDGTVRVNPHFTFSIHPGGSFDTVALLFAPAQLYSGMDSAVGTYNNTAGQCIRLDSLITRADESFIDRFNADFSAGCNTPNYLSPSLSTPASPAVFKCMKWDNFSTSLVGIGHYNQLAVSPFYNAITAANTLWPDDEADLYRERAHVKILSANPTINAYANCLTWTLQLEDSTHNQSYSADAKYVWVIVRHLHNLDHLFMQWDSAGIWRPLRDTLLHNAWQNGMDTAYYLPDSIRHNFNFFNVRISACADSLCTTQPYFELYTGVTCDGVPLPGHLAGLCSPTDIDTFRATLPASSLQLSIHLQNDSILSCATTDTLTVQITNNNQAYIGSLVTFFHLPPGLYVVAGSDSVTYNDTTVSGHITGDTVISINTAVFPNCVNTNCVSSPTGFLPGLLTAGDSNAHVVIIKMLVQATCCFAPLNGSIHVRASGESCHKGDVEQNASQSIYINTQNGLWSNLIASPDTVCFDSSGHNILLSVGGNAATRCWSLHSSASPCFSSLDSVTVHLDSTTTFYLAVTDTAGTCSDTIPITVHVFPLISIGLTDNKRTICKGDTVTLHANTNGTVIHWSSNPSGISSSLDSIMVTPDTTTSYYVTASFGPGTCFGYDTITVHVVPLPLVHATAAPDTVCTGGVTILNGTGNAELWSWAHLPGVQDTVPIIDTVTVNATGYYYLTGSDTAYGLTCSVTDSVQVFTLPLPAISANTYDTTLCAGTAVMLSVSPNSSIYSYLWTPSGTLSCGTCAVTYATDTLSQGYDVSITDSNGCSAYAKIQVSRDLDGCNCQPRHIFYADSMYLYTFSGMTFSNTSIYFKAMTGGGGTFTFTGDMTFHGCDITIDPDVELDQLHGTLLIDNTNYFASHLHACNKMWKGIQMRGADDTLRIDGSNTTHGNVLMEDAFFAVGITDTAYYNIYRCTFNRDNVGLQVSNYTGAHYPGAIGQCRFQCDGYLLAPLSGQNYSTYGMDIENVSAGDPVKSNLELRSTGGFNYFDNLETGINIYESNVRITGGFFTNIHDYAGTLGYGDGSAIYLNGDGGDYYYLGTGSDSATGQYVNRFHNCDNGISFEQAKNSSVVQLYENYMDSMTYEGIRSDSWFFYDNLPAYGSPQINSLIDFNRIRNFGDYGIHVSHMKYPGSIHGDPAYLEINDNLIYNDSSMASVSGDPKTAIRVSSDAPGYFGGLLNHSLLWVRRNDSLYNIQTGIAVENIFSPRIDNNAVIGFGYPAGSSPSASNYCRGISVENGLVGKIGPDNYVKALWGQTPGTADDSFIRGIYVDASTMFYCARNQVDSCGSAIFVTGSNKYGNIVCNTMNEFTRAGVELNNVQASLVGPISNHWGFGAYVNSSCNDGSNPCASDDEWSTNSSSAHRIYCTMGTPGNNGSGVNNIKWWYYPSGSYDIYPSDNDLSPGVFSILTGIEINASSSDWCSSIPEIDDTTTDDGGGGEGERISSAQIESERRDEFLRDIVNDSLVNATYYVEDSIILQYNLNKITYGLLADSCFHWRNLGTADDSLYQAYFVSLDSSDIGRLGRVDAAPNTAQAQNQNAEVQGLDLATANEKAVNNIYLATFALGNHHLNQGQRNTLRSIALQNSYSGGQGVWKARGMLDMSVDEPGVYSERTIKHIRQKWLAPKASESILIYPNPASNQVTVRINNGSLSRHTITIYNIFGMAVKILSPDSEITELTIDLSGLSSGCYIVNVKDCCFNSLKEKLVIVK